MPQNNNNYFSDSNHFANCDIFMENIMISVSTVEVPLSLSFTISVSSPIASRNSSSHFSWQTLRYSRK
jgi:hypothetical protein